MIANKSKTRFALIPVALISALSLGACAENYSAEGGLAGAAAGAGRAPGGAPGAGGGGRAA